MALQRRKLSLHHNDPMGFTFYAMQSVPVFFVALFETSDPTATTFGRLISLPGYEVPQLPEPELVSSSRHVRVMH
jgi:hypothetical protein